LAEVNYLAALREGGSNDKSALAEGIGRSIKNYCRSIELCDNYLRGYYGLKLVSDAPELTLMRKIKLTTILDYYETPGSAYE